MSTVYLFIDGGYLHCRYREAVKKWFGPGVSEEIEFGRLQQIYPAQRTCYYDCLNDLQKEGEEESTFKARVEKQSRYFNEIPAMVTLGSLSGSKKGFRQKRVDILLALDMVNHAVQKNMDKARLIAGDDDFVPVVESLARMGTIVEVIADRKHISSHLIRAADKFRPITTNIYHNWAPSELQEQYPLPGSTSRGIFPDRGRIKTGRIGDRIIEIFEYVKDEYRAYPSWENVAHTHKDIDRLTLYLDLEYGPITWESS